MKKAFRIVCKIMLYTLGIFIAFVACVWLFLALAPQVGRTPDKSARDLFASKTDLFYDGRFHNARPTRVMTEKSASKDARVRPKRILPCDSPDLSTHLEEGEASLTWCGHSSLLFRLSDKYIFIDPITTDRTSPLSFVGPKRFAEIPIPPGDFPELDVVFISHDHYDHLDYDLITRIDSKIKNYVVPLGVDFYLKGWGIAPEKIHSLAWWENVEIDGVVYTLTPAQHFSGRNPLKMNVALWSGLFFTDGVRSIYYTGDSGYCDVFSQVRERLGEPDLMLADSGQYNTAWADIHMTPSQSVQAAKDAGAKWFIPIHWGAYVLSNHAWDDPPKIARLVADELGVNLATPRIGQTVNIDRLEDSQDEWWKDYE